MTSRSGGAAGSSSSSSAEAWLLSRVGETPSSSLGWFRAGVGFFNKREFHFAIDCLQKSVQIDPLNYNAFQIMARACIAVNRRDDAIEALKQSVKLDNPSDWQLLVELTAQEKAAKKASDALLAAADAPDAQPAAAAPAKPAGK